MNNVQEADLAVGKAAIQAYSRLSYTMWYALAEFIDNSTQARLNYGGVIDEVLAGEGQPLIIEIEHNRLAREISIKDNCIGMTKDDLVDALQIAKRTKDSVGRSRYGMGMKTAACWIGKKWKVVTCEWGSGEEWTAEVDVDGIVEEDAKVPLTRRSVSTDAHYTQIVISDLNRNIQKRTEENIRSYLGSMYRFDIQESEVQILYNGEPVPPPDEYDFDTDPQGHPMRRDLTPLKINGKEVSGWVGVLRKGGRKWGGFSLFRKGRQVQGFPAAWKPRSIFGGVDDEGANNLVAQRLVGLIELDDFEVSHTKDAILFMDDEAEQLEQFLEEESRDYRQYAAKRRSAKGQPWSREKVRDLVEQMRKEFTSSEMQDAVSHTILPPESTIKDNNVRLRDSLTDGDLVAGMEILPGLTLVVSLQEKSEHEPHLAILAGAENGTIHVIINGLHPYYSSLESSDQVDECIRQYVYDAIAEYRVNALKARVNPDSVRRLKDSLLRAPILRVENAAVEIQEAEMASIDGAKATGTN